MASIECSSERSASADSNESDIPHVKSELGFTVYYKISDNQPKKLLEVFVINNENERLSFMEECLTNYKLDIKEGDFNETLLKMCERIFQPKDDTITLHKLDNTNPEEPCRPICQFFLKGKCRFGDKCFNMHEIESTEITMEENINNPQSLENKTVNNITKSNKKSSQIVESEKPGKNPPMKTVTDVIKRIQWDERLNPEEFTVGYLDRFVGIVENTFNSFDWDDVTSIDPIILAIPKHRVQYFRYCDEVVWDKNKRLDNVFGSTGSGLTIVDIIEKNKQADPAANKLQIVENS